MRVTFALAFWFTASLIIAGLESTYMVLLNRADPFYLISFACQCLETIQQSTSVNSIKLIPQLISEPMTMEASALHKASQFDWKHKYFRGLSHRNRSEEVN